MQSIFLPIGVLVLIGHAAAGLWSAYVFQLYALSFPLQLLAIWLGNRISRRIPHARFARLVYAMLVVLGVLLLR
jgi:uncharacterized membrane protein YfcA